MSERILGVVENVQTKPPGEWTQKSCDLIFTDSRLLCVKVGGSSLVAGMLGAGIAGPAGAMAFSSDSATEQDSNRDRKLGLSLDQLLASDPGNYAIWYSEVNGGSFKTGFLATLGIMAPLSIQTADRKYFYNVYNQWKDYAKTLIAENMPNVKVS
jgi:hypothetical protein